ncbi:MAG: hypothetical protein B7Z10_12760 [Rhodobacterales bacterium 32-66-7]|nr:MAG: hypothetical protein B7Z10_12760 [Rhodobacterales bacterium 32-66-7]
MNLDPELDLVLEREVNAPREVLYTCWTTPEHLVHWFVPKPHKVTACELDVRPGGACNTTFEVEGNLMENNGVYLEVIPNEKLVFTKQLFYENKDFGFQVITMDDKMNVKEKYLPVTQLEAYAQGLLK